MASNYGEDKRPVVTECKCGGTWISVITLIVALIILILLLQCCGFKFIVEGGREKTVTITAGSPPPETVTYTSTGPGGVVTYTRTVTTGYTRTITQTGPTKTVTKTETQTSTTMPTFTATFTKPPEIYECREPKPSVLDFETKSKTICYSDTRYPGSRTGGKIVCMFPNDFKESIVMFETNEAISSFDINGGTLYYVDWNRNYIYKVDNFFNKNSKPTAIYRHSTYVRAVRVGLDGKIYFSESDGSKGSIYVLEGGRATKVLVVSGPFRFSGFFDFDDSGNIWISTGETGYLYAWTGSRWEFRYKSPGDSVYGFFFLKLGTRKGVCPELVYAAWTGKVVWTIPGGSYRKEIKTIPYDPNAWISDVNSVELAKIYSLGEGQPG